ncbi:sugar-binding transcriptional regulator [Lacticaseibacillus casei]|uniref:sugar-binding transcriptional regulator n=1 Tax=Lacticaseibacillus casei TaxID=1582 RepID=UPI001109CAFF|nr:sugar-binding transcriptional regulator [Lacticaseibacillus casei]TLQ50440.1 sugar-binding transcriptional regulator [Lacticaseibacillus casei]
MSEQPDDFVARVAYLYYVKDKTQSQIAKTINIDRSTVSRLLKRARAKGIVTVRVNHANTEIFELEEKLRQAFKLRQVVIIPSSASDSVEAKNQQLATAAAHYLKRVIKPHDRVGFAWGTTLAGMIGQLNHPVHTNAIFVPLVGGPSPKNTKYHVNAIVYDATRQFNGKALFIDAAAVQKTQALHDQIVNSQKFQPVRDAWAHLDLAFVGIGGALRQGTSRWRDLLSTQDFDELSDREVIGDCCCTFFDRNGKILRGDLFSRTIAIDPKQLKTTPNTVAVARGLSKAPAINACLRMDLINTLITDQQTAERINTLRDK